MYHYHLTNHQSFIKDEQSTTDFTKYVLSFKVGLVMNGLAHLQVMYSDFQTWSLFCVKYIQLMLIQIS